LRCAPSAPARNVEQRSTKCESRASYEGSSELDSNSRNCCIVCHVFSECRHVDSESIFGVGLSAIGTVWTFQPPTYANERRRKYTWCSSIRHRRSYRKLFSEHGCSTRSRNTPYHQTHALEWMYTFYLYPLCN